MYSEKAVVFHGQIRVCYTISVIGEGHDFRKGVFPGRPRRRTRITDLKS